MNESGMNVERVTLAFFMQHVQFNDHGAVTHLNSLGLRLLSVCPDNAGVPPTLPPTLRPPPRPLPSLSILNLEPFLFFIHVLKMSL